MREESRKMLADRLCAALTMRGMTQRRLAEEADITEVSLSRYIRENRIPKVDMIADICDVLGVSIDWLMGRTDSPYEVYRGGNDETARKYVNRLCCDNGTAYFVSTSVRYCCRKRN